MKKSTIWFITIIMAVTFAGLIYVQFLYMNNMVRMRDDQFEESVRRSLYAVSSMLEQEETRHFLEENLAQVDNCQRYKVTPSTEGVSMSFTTPSGRRGNLTIEDALDKLPGSSPVPSSLTPKAGGNLEQRSRTLQETLRGRYLYQRGLIDEVILNIIARSSNRPIAQRADSLMVRNFLRFELENNGLKIPFEFAVANRNGALIYHTAGFPSGVSRQEERKEVYTQPLFPNDPINKINYLEVYFPTKADYLFSSIRFMIPSFAFTFILLLIFIYAIMVAFRQKKVNEMKNDFINNMTHELKTPISSLSLAGQMLGDASVRKSDTMMRHIAEVINDDTKRLRFMVEKVLQMSLYYNQKSVLNLVALDANKVIAASAHSVKLRVEKVGGRIELDLAAGRSLVKVDEMHFANLITNLLDNAVKYRSEEHPLILKIATEDLPHNKLQITVTDTGIGIRKDDLRKIFDKFFRVSTGDRHDVKGFGLGLAYVKKMVEEFGGEITAESEFGRGTTFTLTLPLAPDQE
ncbi:alkaline phosphatase synthesis sensor protein PhoR [Muribaculaceae bacterium]|jgi:signal transduction histidine kinase|nr:alkaline phosphatase synthesis sensor protein PhoR [Muribaculaceae bacterium]